MNVVLRSIILCYVWEWKRWGKSESSGEEPQATTGEKPNAHSISSLSPNASSFSQTAMVQHGGSRVTVLQTAKSHIVNKTQSVAINLLFDTGSDRTFILSKVANQCNLKAINYE